MSFDGRCPSDQRSPTRLGFLRGVARTRSGKPFQDSSGRCPFTKARSCDRTLVSGAHVARTCCACHVGQVGCRPTARRPVSPRTRAARGGSPGRTPRGSPPRSSGAARAAGCSRRRCCGGCRECGWRGRWSSSLFSVQNRSHSHCLRRMRGLEDPSARPHDASHGQGKGRGRSRCVCRRRFSAFTSLSRSSEWIAQEGCRRGRSWQVTYERFAERGGMRGALASRGPPRSSQMASSDSLGGACRR